MLETVPSDDTMIQYTCRVQYYPLFKGYTPESYTPHLNHSWCGVVADYTVVKPGTKAVKKTENEIGKLVDVPEVSV